MISIRGTFSLEDVLTDLDGENVEIIFNENQRGLCHKGMLRAAVYIRDKLLDTGLLEKAFNFNTSDSRNTRDFDIVIVGHSLGAGTASILGILLKDEYQSLKCYCYSPPGGLLWYIFLM